MAGDSICQMALNDLLQAERRHSEGKPINVGRARLAFRIVEMSNEITKCGEQLAVLEKIDPRDRSEKENLELQNLGSRIESLHFAQRKFTEPLMALMQQGRAKEAIANKSKEAGPSPAKARTAEIQMSAFVSPSFGSLMQTPMSVVSHAANIRRVLCPAKG
jgi:hypothetical protein